MAALVRDLKDVLLCHFSDSERIHNFGRFQNLKLILWYISLIHLLPLLYDGKIPIIGQKRVAFGEELVVDPLVHIVMDQ